MLEEAEQLGNSISSVARKYEVHPDQLFKLRRLIHKYAHVVKKDRKPLYLYLKRNSFRGNLLISASFREEDYGGRDPKGCFRNRP